MRTDVLQRLKALGATDAKIAALAVAFDEDTIAALLGQVEMTDKDAADMQIAYKEQDMPARLPTATDIEANRFEIALKEAQIDDRLHDGLWDIWAGSPSNAHAIVARFKGGSTDDLEALVTKKAERLNIWRDAVAGDMTPR
jgi:hypothetical protein